MTAYSRRRGVICNYIRWRWEINYMPRSSDLRIQNRGTHWTGQLEQRAFWREINYLAPVRNWTPEYPTGILVIIPTFRHFYLSWVGKTELFRLARHLINSSYKYIKINYAVIYWYGGRHPIDARSAVGNKKNLCFRCLNSFWYSNNFPCHCFDCLRSKAS